MLTNEDLKKIGEVVEIKLKPVRSDIRKLKKDLDAVISFFDRREINHERRIKRYE